MVQLSTISIGPTCCSMGRVTINLNDRDHLAFKLLALQRDKRLVILIQDAMRDYLERNGAYDLSIQGGSHSDDEL